MGEEGQEDWEVVENRRKKRTSGVGRRLGSTFFFRNFPEDCKEEELRWIFGSVGKVEDVFIPGKRDKKGGRFGFVRMSKGGSDLEMLENLNKIWIGSYRIRAFQPRFKRNSNEVKRQPTRNVKEVKKQSCQKVTGWKGGNPKVGIQKPQERTIGKTYVEILQGNSVAGQRDRKIGTLEESEVKFQSLDGEGDWLRGAFTGYLKKDYSWKEHGMEMATECMGRLRITDMGNNLILIQSITESPTEETLGGYMDWANFWLEWWRPWTYTDVNQRREVGRGGSEFHYKHGMEDSLALHVPNLVACKNCTRFCMCPIWWHARIARGY